MRRPVVFIHTDDEQLLPALVAVHSLRTRGGGPDTFDIRIVRVEGSPLDARSDGRPYYYAGGRKIWDHTTFQAFHYLRRWAPELMGYRGRALVLDPDIFAVRSIVPLLERDMEGKAILARYLPNGYANNGHPIYSSGVMLLDCARLTDWRWHEEIEALFAGKLDYMEMLQLAHQDRATIGELGAEWNSFDELTEETRLLHFTRLSTQPWSKGLPLRKDAYDPSATAPAATWWQKLRRIESQALGRSHPDPRQEAFFFVLLRECLENELLSEAFVRAEIRGGRFRSDGMELLERAGYVPGSARGAALLNEFVEPEQPPIGELARRS